MDNNLLEKTKEILTSKEVWMKEHYHVGNENIQIEDWQLDTNKASILILKKIGHELQEIINTTLYTGRKYSKLKKIIEDIQKD